MSASRSRREVKNYDKYVAGIRVACEFCTISKNHHQYVSETSSFFVIKNIFPYSLWDNQNVEDHLLVVPKKYVDSLSKLSDQQAGEYVKLLSDYEARGYNVYARAPGSVMKTVLHQHTHLIKPMGGPRRFIFLIRKPYVRFVA